jgi:hypothetical protein
MQSENRLTPPEHELESALLGLQPAAASINRDRLMFRAGQASVRCNSRLWQGATALLAVACIVSLVTPPFSRDTEPADIHANQHDISSPQSLASAQPSDWNHDRRLADASYLKLRRAVLNRGLDALAASARASSPDTERAKTFDQLLDSPSGDIRYQGLLGTRPFLQQGEPL